MARDHDNDTEESNDNTCPNCGTELELFHGDIVYMGNNEVRMPVYCEDCDETRQAYYSFVGFE